MVSREHRTSIAKQIKEKITLRSAVTKDMLGFTRAKTGKDMTAKIVIPKTKRPPLSAFEHRVKKSRMEGRGGVSYKIDQSAGRKTITDAFTVEKYQSVSDPLQSKNIKDIFVRHPRTDSRGKIVRLWGVSVWKVFLKHKMHERAEREMQVRAVKMVKRNIRGAIRAKLGT